MKRAFCTALAIGAFTSPLLASPAHADLLGYQVVVQANVVQFTEDFPTAPARPIVEADVGYTYANIDGSRAHALASPAWPGSLVGNAGSLLGVLGYQPQPLLNDPVRVEAPTATGTTASLGAGTAQMTASVAPSGPDQKTATAQTTLGSVGAPPIATIASSSSVSTANLDQTTGRLTAKAVSAAAGVDIAGVITIGAVTSSVTATSDNGAKPKFSGSTTFTDLKIAGQEAYVDASGVHLGAVGNPTGQTVLNLVNQIVSNAGMKVYFSSAQMVTIAGVAYYYPASILIYWTPPGDSNHDTLTYAVGGAAASMTVTQSTSSVTTAAPSSSGSTQASTLGPVQQFPTPPAGSAATVTPPPPVAPPTTSSAPVQQAALPPLTKPAGFSPAGLGAWWLVLLALAAIAGAVALPRVPALIRAAAPPCDRELPWKD